MLASLMPYFLFVEVFWLFKVFEAALRESLQKKDSKIAVVNFIPIMISKDQITILKAWFKQQQMKLDFISLPMDNTPQQST